MGAGRGATRCSVALVAAVALVSLAAGCGSSGTVQAGSAATTIPTSTAVSVPPSGPARDYARYIVHADVSIAGPRGTLSPLSATQLDVVIKAPDHAWVEGASTPSGTAVERGADLGGDQILLGSYSAPFPRTGTSVDFDHRIVWIRVGHPLCSAPGVTNSSGRQPRGTSWTIIDARTGEMMEVTSEGDASCQGTGGP